MMRIHHKEVYFVSSNFNSNRKHAQRLYDYSVNTGCPIPPILSFGRSKKEYISCFLNYINDTAEGLVENLSETRNWYHWGGVGIGFGIRSSDDKSTGVMPTSKLTTHLVWYRQGRTRRVPMAYLIFHTQM